MLALYRSLRLLYAPRKAMRLALIATAPGYFPVPMERGQHCAQDRAHSNEAGHAMKYGRRVA